jgi:uncharacterized protein YqeY
MAAALKSLMDEIGAKSMADMGRAMKSLNERLAGKADGAALAAAVKQVLSGG